MSKTITLEFTDYKITGTAHIILWGGEPATIPMDPYHVDNIETDEEIIEGANDAGFGCEKIVSVDVEIYENYEGHNVFLDEKTIEIKDDSTTKKGL